jgi:L-fuconolactonase
MTEEHRSIDRTFEPEDLEPLLSEHGIDATVLVQGAASDEDTDYLVAHAARYARVKAVVAWLDLANPDAAASRLDVLTENGAVRGVRALVHQEPDPHFLTTSQARRSLEYVTARGLVLEVPAVYPLHLADVADIAGALPELTLVIDHLGKPPIGTTEMTHWAELLGATATCPNVNAKFSGLTTSLRGGWGAEDLVEALTVALECFGAARLLAGSDWPVCLLSGDYGRVWRETVRAIEMVAREGRDPILGGTACALYRIDDEETGGGTD